MGTRRSKIDKEAIITEYLAGGITFRKLGQKHGIDYRTIHAWVSAYQGKPNPKHKVFIEVKQDPDNPLPEEVKQLQNELRKAQLHNKLLEAIIDIGQEKYGIDLRKKPGAKRS
jgi:transposase-like protein